MIVTKVHFSVQICTPESNVVVTCTLYCPDNIRDGMETSFFQVSIRACRCAHITISIPGFATDDDRRFLLTILLLSRATIQHIISHGPMKRVNLFQHGLQVYYSKSKGGVDGVSQFRAAINHPGGCSNWEENMVT